MIPSTSSSKLRLFWQRCRARFGRSGLILLAALTLVMTGAGVHAVTGPKPWGREVVKRLEAGKTLRAREHGIVGVWRGCVATFVIGGLLLCSAGGWIPRRKAASSQILTEPIRGGWPFYLALGLIVFGGAVWRVPPMAHSLWNDEEYALRNYVHGEWESETDGTLKFKKVAWEETLFQNYKSNNHLLQSALSRLSLESWRVIFGKGQEDFNEAAVRAPSFVAGVLTLFLLGLVGLRCGGPLVGLGAAALLALHPWHVRYAVEARGYSLMMFFIVLALLALIEAIRTDRLLPWLGFVVAEAGFLLSFAGSLYIAVGLNLLAAWEMLRRREPRRLLTLIGFNLLAAIPVLIWMLPTLPQMLDFLEREKVLEVPIGLPWARDLGSHWVAGIMYENSESHLHSGSSWREQSGPIWWMPWVGIVFPLIAVVGLVVAARRSFNTRLAVWSVIGGGGLAIAQNALAGQSMLSWYLLYLIVPLALAVPLAVSLIPQQWVRWMTLVIVVLGYGLATDEVRGRYMHHDRQPIRQTAASYRVTHPDALAVVFGVSDLQFQSYDPRAKAIRTVAELEQHLETATERGELVFAVVCGSTASRQRTPELAARVFDGGDFVKESVLPGQEAMFSYEVWRWIGKAP